MLEAIPSNILSLVSVQRNEDLKQGHPLNVTQTLGQKFANYGLQIKSGLLFVSLN